MSDEKIPIALVYKIDTLLGTQTKVYACTHLRLNTCYDIEYGILNILIPYIYI